MTSAAAAGRRVVFLSDFGLADEFVGVVHAVITGFDPSIGVVDLTHQIPAHDIKAGAAALWRAAPWLPPGVILAVVDPGVGTERRALAIRAAGAPAFLVGPDNGLLRPALERLGGPAGAVELPPAPAVPGTTFAGRDIFAPAAARIAAGARLEDLGDPVALEELADLGFPPIPRPIGGGRILTEVVWIDRFGNAQLGARPADLSRPPAQPANRPATGAAPPRGAGPASAPEAEVEFAGRLMRLRIVASYGDIAGRDYALVVDSYGLLSICADRRSAAGALGITTGTPVTLGP